MSDFVEELVSAGFAMRSEIVGCSEIEVSELEGIMNVRLPQVYRDFLTMMGKGVGHFSKGTDFLYESLFGLRDDFTFVLEQDNFLQVLTPDVFVFSGHQGVIFHFFYTDTDNPDPEIYGYLEGDRKVKHINNSFSGFLSEWLKQEGEITKHNRLLSSFNDNRATNPEVALQAGREYIEKYGNEFRTVAESMKNWIDSYEKTRRSWLTRLIRK